MIAKLIGFVGLGVLLVSPALALDDLEKCEGKLKCRQGSSAASHGIKQLSGSQPSSNSSHPIATVSSGKHR